MLPSWLLASPSWASEWGRSSPYTLQFTLDVRVLSKSECLCTESVRSPGLMHLFRATW